MTNTNDNNLDFFFLDVCLKTKIYLDLNNNYARIVLKFEPGVYNANKLNFLALQAKTLFAKTFSLPETFISYNILNYKKCAYIHVHFYNVNEINFIVLKSFLKQ